MSRILLYGMATMCTCNISLSLVCQECGEHREPDHFILTMVLISCC